MKKIYFEDIEDILEATSATSQQNVWDEADTYLVTKPPLGSGGGGGGGGEPSSVKRPKIHWPEAVVDDSKDDASTQPSKPSDIEDDVEIITDPKQLTQEDIEDINRELRQKQQSQDKHIEGDTTGGEPSKELTPEQIEKVTRGINDKKKKAEKAQRTRNAGSTGMSTDGDWGVVNSRITIHKAVTDWKKELREFFLPWTSRKIQNTYTRVNRRDMLTTNTAPTIIRPGMQKAPPTTNKLQIFITVDTSGSVDDRMLGDFFSEINGIFTSTVCEESNIEVRVIEWTGNVTGDILLNNYNYRNFFSKVKRTASGSTNFDAIKLYMNAKRYKPAAIVHFTDGYIDVNRSMMVKENNCKNLLVVPNGLPESILWLKDTGCFDRIIIMNRYDLKQE